MSLTEGDLQEVFNSLTVWCRCAGYVLVRICVNHERYWDLLNHALLDDEEFIPFPRIDNKGDNKGTTVGQFVENLLAKDKYCQMPLPRIPIATRKVINMRLALNRQFRQRYTANYAVIERYREPKVEVEVSNADGEWRCAQTVGSTSSDDRERCIMTRVRFPDGREENVSLGMVIRPNAPFSREDIARRNSLFTGERHQWDRDDDDRGEGRQKTDREDLTRERGKSSNELMDQLLQEQRDGAVAKGKEYCKKGPVTVNPMGGVPLHVGVKRKELEQETIESDDDSEVRREKQIANERWAKQQAITAKYHAGVAQEKEQNPDIEKTVRMRLG